MQMFCYQCQETAKGEGCTVKGVCGKTAEVAALQDLLVQAVKGIARYAHRVRQLGVADREVDLFVVEALFTTVTNVNFDPLRMREMLMRAAKVKEQARALYVDACARNDRRPDELSGPATWTPAVDLDGLIRQGQEVTIEKRIGFRGQDLAGLEELLTYGLKGMAAYADHAQVLGQEDDDVYAFFHEALDLLTRDDTTVDELLAMNLKCGEVNLTVMGLLDAANTGAYGHPEPTQVRITPVKGKAILVSGHGHVLIGPIREEMAEYLKTVTFFVNPNQLSLLMLGAVHHAHPDDPPPVLAPFGSGCGQMLTLFTDLPQACAVIGATDIAIRRFLPPDRLALTVTVPMLDRLLTLDPERSFLGKPFLRRLREARRM